MNNAVYYVYMIVCGNSNADNDYDDYVYVQVMIATIMMTIIDAI